MNKNNADVKLSLIDLEASNIVTGGKQFNNNVRLFVTGKQIGRAHV